MKIVIVAASSKDGFIANDTSANSFEWTSKEDKRFLSSMVAAHPLIVMGSTTYANVPQVLSPDTLRIVLTRQPEAKAKQAVPGQLEFVAMTPQEIIDTYQEKYDSCLVLGGSQVYTQFLQSGVVTDVYQTVEPVEFGSGVPFIQGGLKLEDLVDVSSTLTIELNDSGTVLHHYSIKC